MHVQHNTVVRSRNHCYSGKVKMHSMSIECICVGLEIIYILTLSRTAKLHTFRVGLDCKIIHILGCV